MSDCFSKYFAFADPAVVARVEQRIKLYNQLLQLGLGQSRVKGRKLKEQKQQLKRKYLIHNRRLYRRGKGHHTMVFLSVAEV